MPIVLLFARHGQTADDLPGREKVSGWKELSLNEEGKLEARRLARFLNSKGINKILSSDTKRCLQTAEIISKEIRVPVAKTPLLRSWNMGSVEGMYSEAAKPFLKFFEKSFNTKIPNGEKFITFHNRFKGAFWGIVRFVRKFPDVRMLILTHSQNLDLIEWFRDGIVPGKVFEFGEGLPAGGACEVRIYEDGTITIRKVFGKGREAGG